MLILIPCLFLFVPALALVILRATQPNARYGWLVATGGAALGFFGVFAWLAVMPFDWILPAWQPLAVFPTPISFRADGVSWALATSIFALILSILLTGAIRRVSVHSFSWIGALALGGFGALAVAANNPVTLVLMWSSLDLAELLAQLSSAQSARNNERAVISFATRIAGSAFLLWSYITSFSNGSGYTFQSIPSSAGAYLVIAVGLRLGVFPLHLPYDAGSALRRGFGTALRLVGAVASLGALGRGLIVPSGATPFLAFFASVAALYGGWMWLRSPDELTGRPYWMIGIAALSVLSALSGSPTGAAAWACALILAGGALFLSSVQDARLNRALLGGAWSLSSLPFSLTASAWTGSLGFFFPFALAAQALMTAGFVRHALRPSGDDSLADQPAWARGAYPAGIVLLLIVQLLLGFLGWDSALQIGNLIFAPAASLLALGLVWGSRRFRVLNPARAHWVSAAGSGINGMYQGLWSMYRGLARLGLAVTDALEGEGGIMWTLLFMALFISIIAGGIQ
ncbi:MAG: hypothetical protein DYG85_10455 [Chloroflexi bacterium CFX1]|nr:hypothetical protein [Chloroflexi bacterium CFX1]MCQ3952442.1 hypothetical protein [Chloroflexota bacterium]MDL1919078.1 hypothetical protein [Chloroflexi bacterium CFX5]NUQ59034.1 hypothetical protein [Anaerolineales bacterium]